MKTKPTDQIEKIIFERTFRKSTQNLNCKMVATEQ